MNPSVDVSVVDDFQQEISQVGKSTYREAELKVFALPDFYTVMRNMGATSEFYETNDFEVSDDVVDERDQLYRQTKRQVGNDHLTVEELYRGIMDF
ncbi:hypothetical protein [Halobacterium sp. KA-6]|jgi:hypothetical protein|uniref:hypothetical protein n=1 Tax=Halobacterium sp. KA-6 TaxID=2896368 RepID=UPI001E52B9D7|nr:hypothetical protein [Halobacterium sp. KA-6]MCD2203330.1 hypothetical protein [Halobacterium sp. KA-6]